MIHNNYKNADHKLGPPAPIKSTFLFEKSLYKFSLPALADLLRLIVDFLVYAP